MTDFWSVLRSALDDGTCLSLVLSRRREDRTELPDRVSVRPIEVQGQPLFQWALRSGAKESHENLTAAATAERVGGLLGPAYSDCHLFTTEADYAARCDARGSVALRKGPPTKSAAPKSHDRQKEHLIPDGVPCPFLIEIGVMTPAGRVKRSKYSKFRQVNRFLELVNDTVSSLPASGTLHVVDFGCGKSYLTFALHHLLTRVHRRSVRILGLDRNPDVVRSCEEVAGRLGLSGIEFRVGDIASCTVDFRVDLAVSLHACDTATDDALARAVAWQTPVILAVPCCQHELAAKLQKSSLDAVTRHGVLKERFSALATDALRALALEVCGYKVQVVEFIDMEHTAKNILIRAVRRPRGQSVPADVGPAYLRLKETLGVDRICLESALGPAFRASLEGAAAGR